jgi:hypothetical protein
MRPRIQALAPTPLPGRDDAAATTRGVTANIVGTPGGQIAPAERNAATPAGPGAPVRGASSSSAALDSTALAAPKPASGGHDGGSDGRPATLNDVVAAIDRNTQAMACLSLSRDVRRMEWTLGQQTRMLSRVGAATTGQRAVAPATHATATGHVAAEIDGGIASSANAE